MKDQVVEKRFALTFAEIKSRDNALWALARAGQIAEVYLGSRVDQELWESLGTGFSSSSITATEYLAEIEPKCTS
jgi:hypothetical protein